MSDYIILYPRLKKEYSFIVSFKELSEIMNMYKANFTAK